MEKKVYKYKDFGDHLKRARKMKYGDVKSFSKASGITLKLLYEYESGRVFPPIEKFIIICKTLDKSPTYMLSPLLDMNDQEKELIYLYQDTDVRGMLQDEDLKDILKFTLLGFQIFYLTKNHFKHKGDIINYLDELKSKLFEGGQLKKIIK